MKPEAIKRSKEVFPEIINDIPEAIRMHIDTLRRGFRIGYNDALEQNQKDTIYMAMCCPDVNESADTPISVHRTREGAQKAIEFDKMEKMKIWEDLWPTEEQRESNQFGEYEDWSIKEIKILD